MSVPLSVLFFLALEKDDIESTNKEEITHELSQVINEVTNLFNLDGDNINLLSSQKKEAGTLV